MEVDGRVVLLDEQGGNHFHVGESQCTCPTTGDSEEEVRCDPLHVLHVGC